MSGCTFVEDRSAEPVVIVDAKAANSSSQPLTTKPLSPIKSQLYRVQKGDTLGSIAYKFLGSAGYYTKIASLNNINPSQPIHLGQQLLIPTSSNLNQAATITSQPIKLATKSVQKEPQNAEAISKAISEKDYKLALNLLLKEASEKNSGQIQQQIKTTAQAYSNSLTEQNKPFEAKNMLNRLTAHSNVSAVNKLAFTDQLNQINCQEFIDKALQSNQQNKPQETYIHLKSAFEIAPQTAQESSDFVNLRDEITESKHQEALRYYRKQQLTQALNAWQEILAIKPNDDLAIVYIDRVKAIQQKLEEL